MPWMPTYGDGDPHPARPERIPGPGRDRLRVLRPVGAGRRVPPRVELLVDDLELAERRRVLRAAGRDLELADQLRLVRRPGTGRAGSSRGGSRSRGRARRSAPRRAICSNGSSSGARCCVLSARTIARAATTSLSRRPGTSFVAKGVRLRSLSVASTGSRWKRLPSDATRRSTFGRGDVDLRAARRSPARLTRAASCDRLARRRVSRRAPSGVTTIAGAGAADERERPGEARLARARAPRPRSGRRRACRRS